MNRLHLSFDCIGDFGAFGVFSANLSAPILVQWVPCPCFLLKKHYFNKKLSLYIHILNIYLGSGFEFGPQKNYGFSLPVSVTHGLTREKRFLSFWGHLAFTIDIFAICKIYICCSCQNSFQSSLQFEVTVRKKCM